MALPASFRFLAVLLLLSSLVNLWAIAQSYLRSTLINGVAFPRLIDATTEDLAAGLEAGLFTSVDLVNVPS